MNIFFKKGEKEIDPFIELIIKHFDAHTRLKPHELLKLESDEQILSKLDWPEQIFYYLNEELANLNRNFIRTKNSEIPAVNYSQELIFGKVFNLLKVCFILSK